MSFVKLDCNILTSTLWSELAERNVFITALLLATPVQLDEPEPQIAVRTLDYTGFVVPPGWYGFSPAAGPGIVRMSGVGDEEGMKALEKLCAPDPGSRTPDFEGRRLARVNGGYIVLNYDKYREKDHTASERSRRYRQRKKIAKDKPSRGQTFAERLATNGEYDGEPVETIDREMNNAGL